MFILTKDQLPPEGKYVIARHNRTTWHDSTDQENVNTVIVKLKKGISLENRLKMINGELPDPLIEGWNLSEGVHKTPRHRIYNAEDQHGNNHVPYCWLCFGPDQFFGQEITEWMEIPKSKQTTSA